MQEKHVEAYIEGRLFELQDPAYRDFHSRLMPTIDKETIIGVRTPQLRKLAKELSRMPESAEFLRRLPHRYYEENNLHGFLIEMIRDYDACIEAINTFLPYVDNWATCDLMMPKVFAKHLPELLVQAKEWIASDATYTVRFGIGVLMRFYLDEEFSLDYAELVAGVRSEEYYVNMMVAWYFATALAKQYEAVLPFLEQRRLDRWTHNKAIQKAVESYRITDEQKAYLKTLNWSRH